jgi:hypothetical protein
VVRPVGVVGVGWSSAEVGERKFYIDVQDFAIGWRLSRTRGPDDDGGWRSQMPNGCYGCYGYYTGTQPQPGGPGTTGRTAKIKLIRIWPYHSRRALPEPRPGPRPAQAPARPPFGRIFVPEALAVSQPQGRKDVCCTLQIHLALEERFFALEFSRQAVPVQITAAKAPQMPISEPAKPSLSSAGDLRFQQLKPPKCIPIELPTSLALCAASFALASVSISKFLGSGMSF